MTAEMHESPERKRRHWFHYRRRSCVLFALALCMALGVFCYLALHGGYQSRMELLVCRPDGEAWDSRQFVRFEWLFSASDVLAGAIAKLAAGPPQTRVDLPLATADRWGESLRSRLTVRSVRYDGEPTGVLEITYRSKDPQAAQAVTDAIGKSYLDFVERSSRDDSLCLAIQAIQGHHQNICQELQGKEQELQDARKEANDKTILENEAVVLSGEEQVQRLYDALTAVRHERLELEAMLASLQAASHAGEDMRQYLPAVEATVLSDGEREVTTPESANCPDGEACVKAQRQLQANRVKLRVLLEHSDRNHPLVAQRLAAIRGAEEFLNNSAHYRKLVLAGVATFPGDGLGSMVVQAVQKRLETLQEHERILVEQHRRADAEAVSRKQQMAEIKTLEDDVQRLRGLRYTLLERVAYMDPVPTSVSTRACVLSEPQAGRRPIALWVTAVLVLAIGMVLIHVSDGWICRAK